MTVRRMVVVRTPGTTDTPCIRISNRMLEAVSKLAVGTPIEVIYRKDEITIRKVNDHYEPNNLQGKPVCPVSHPAPTFGAACAEEGAGHPRGGTSHSGGSPEPMRDVRALRYVLRGHWSPIHGQNAGTDSRTVRAQ